MSILLSAVAISICPLEWYLLYEVFENDTNLITD